LEKRPRGGGSPVVRLVLIAGIIGAVIGVFASASPGGLDGWDVARALPLSIILILMVMRLSVSTQPLGRMARHLSVFLALGTVLVVGYSYRDDLGAIFGRTLGTVVPGPGLGPARRRAWAGRHQLRDGHPHVHGANLGVRGDAYLALGGWPALPTGEDTELARRASSAGHLRIARTAAIPVVTSTRRAGRAPQGFSGYLRDLSPGGLAGAPACGQ